MKNICIKSLDNNPNYGEHYTCKTCYAEHGYGFRLTEKPVACPYCGCRFDLYYEIKGKKHPYFKLRQKTSKPIFRYNIEFTETGYTSPDTEYTHCRKTYLSLIYQIKEDGDYLEEPFEIKTTMKLINGKKGELL